MHEIETARLQLRPIAVTDLDAIHALWIDQEVRRYLWDDEIIARQVAADVIERSQAQFRDHGHGLWLARRPEAEAIVGFCGFWHFHEPPQLELLYGLAPSHWGRGLATELAVVLLRHGFEVLGFDTIIASTDAPNLASARVMERAGMQFQRRETLDGKDTVFYISRRS